MEISVDFDRADRLYRFGDLVSGSVVVESESARSYSEIWVTYRWRTHGRGNRDQGTEEKLTLSAEKTSFRSGERRRFPFRFTAPNGPVTYHGRYLNVDWYLTAHARSGPLSASKSEQDFLLQAGDRTGAVVLGDKEVPRKDLPLRSYDEVRPSSGILEVKAGSQKRRSLASRLRPIAGLLSALILFAAGILFNTSFDWDPLLAFAVPSVALILVLIAVATLFANAYRRKLDLRQVWVRPTIVRGGSEVRCHVDFVAKRRVHLNSITASITARERTTRTAGTATVTEVHLLNEKTYTRPFDEDLSEGRWVAFECALPVGPDLPPSFSSLNNALEWAVTMKAAFKGWPAWQKTFPITVLP